VNTMNPFIRVDTDALSPAEDSYTSAGDEVSRIYGLANAMNEQYTGCWGNDSIGRMFASAYQPAADNVLTGIKSIADSLANTVQGIITMIKGYTDTEENNISAVHGSPDVPDDTTRR
jgi:hypothetical protein